MSTKREKHYQCIFSSKDGEFSFRVSAWTQKAAEEIFREALVRAGIAEPGTVSVRDLRGRFTLPSRSEPSTFNL
jgi:hypothetical protein